MTMVVKMKMTLSVKKILAVKMERPLLAGRPWMSR